MNFQVHHIAVIMRDRGEAIDFFVNKLGMELLKESESGKRSGYKLEIGVGGKYIFEVFAVPGAVLETDPDWTTGYNHMSFGVDDVAETLKELAGRGIEVTEPYYDAPAGHHYGFFYGPDHVKFEVYEL